MPKGFYILLVVLLLVFLLFLLFLQIKNNRKEINKLSKNLKDLEIENQSLHLDLSDKSEKENVVSLLTDLLNIGLMAGSLTDITLRMVYLLRDYYNVKYVSFFIKNSDGWYTIISTNIPKYRIIKTERHYNEQLATMSTETRVEILDGYDGKSYLGKNNLEYSNFSLIKQNGVVIGALLLEHNNKNEIEHNNNQFKLYDKVFNTTSLVLKHVIEIGEMVKRVSTDQLTGVYNRRFIDLTLHDEIEKHKNLGQSFHIALLDIDFFKKFNDTYGHQFGDKVLQEVSGYISRNLGIHSWVARYGGEEFLIFIANSNMKRVQIKIEEIRKGISELNLAYEGQNAKVTASFGISRYPKHGLTQEELIGNADKALYESKATGRNKVTVFNNNGEV